ncbi:MAG: pyridoxamine 5-phosphate oxidase-related FMN-binding [Ilumatobacteraceae bacterium]|nr:pyridoxamine 5-phosphate oxidase-related FMN-binding [Ilumatobacteraceae bacterium]
MSYPDSALDLLQAPGTAILSTVTPSGQIQSTALWYLLDDGVLKISLAGSRKKLRNLQEDPSLTFFVLDPANPFHFVEIRGTASITPDPDYSFRDKVGVQYSTDVSTFDQPGEARFVVTVEPTTVNAQ